MLHWWNWSTTIWISRERVRYIYIGTAQTHTESYWRHSTSLYMWTYLSNKLESDSDHICHGLFHYARWVSKPQFLHLAHKRKQLYGAISVTNLSWTKTSQATFRFCAVLHLYLGTAIKIMHTASWLYDQSRSRNQIKIFLSTDDTYKLKFGEKRSRWFNLGDGDFFIYSTENMFWKTSMCDSCMCVLPVFTPLTANSDYLKLPSPWH